MLDDFGMDRLGGWTAGVSHVELIAVTVLAMLIGWIGTLLLRQRMAIGRLLSTASTLFLGGVLIVVVMQLVHIDPQFMAAFKGANQRVEGGETRIDLAPDGHFWLDAEVNGHPTQFLVDTGATLTAISQKTAASAGVTPEPGRFPVRLVTANGAIEANLTELDQVTFGNITASSVDAVIAPNLGDTNVIGMNVLSRLASWRVEGKTLILVPGKDDAPTL